MKKIVVDNEAETISLERVLKNSNSRFIGFRSLNADGSGFLIIDQRDKILCAPALRGPAWNTFFAMSGESLKDVFDVPGYQWFVFGSRQEMFEWCAKESENA